MVNLLSARRWQREELCVFVLVFSGCLLLPFVALCSTNVLRAL